VTACCCCCFRCRCWCCGCCSSLPHFTMWFVQRSVPVTNRRDGLHPLHCVRTRVIGDVRSLPHNCVGLAASRAGFYATFTVRRCTVYCTVLYCNTVLYCTVLYCTVLYCTVLYCTVLYCTVLYCTACQVVRGAWCVVRGAWCVVRGACSSSAAPSYLSVRPRRQLYLYSTNIEGVVPSTLGRLPSLQILNLDNNFLVGSLPNSLSALTNLKYVCGTCAACCCVLSLIATRVAVQNLVVRQQPTQRRRACGRLPAARHSHQELSGQPRPRLCSDVLDSGLRVMCGRQAVSGRRRFQRLAPQMQKPVVLFATTTTTCAGVTTSGALYRWPPDDHAASTTAAVAPDATNDAQHTWTSERHMRQLRARAESASTRAMSTTEGENGGKEMGRGETRQVVVGISV
jgi:hypothetical protein